MENTSVKIPVPPDIYETIKEIQQNLKVQEGKKTSLSEIMLRLCSDSIKSLQNMQNKEQNAQDENNFAQNNNCFTQNPDQNTQISGINILPLKPVLNKFEQELHFRQKYLTEREAEIRNTEIILYEHRESLFEKERELIRMDENMVNEKYKLKISSIETEIFKRENEYFKKILSSDSDRFLKDTDKIDYSEFTDELTSVKEELSDIKKVLKMMILSNILNLY